MCAQRTQISLGIRPVWSESSLCIQRVAKDPNFMHADSDQTGRMSRLIWVFAGRTCHFVGFVVRQLYWTLIFTLRIFHTCELFARILHSVWRIRMSSSQISNAFVTHVWHIRSIPILHIAWLRILHIARNTPKKVAFLLHKNFSHVFLNLFNNFVCRKF